jgi:hypothetical protein
LISLFRDGHGRPTSKAPGEIHDRPAVQNLSLARFIARRALSRHGHGRCRIEARARVGYPSGKQKRRLDWLVAHPGVLTLLALPRRPGRASASNRQRGPPLEEPPPKKRRLSAPA